MRTGIRLFSLVALTALTVGYSSSGGGADTAADAPTDAAQFVSLTNQLRASQGLGALSVDPALTAMASRWSDQMAAAGTISHNPNLATQAPSDWQTLGENVGMGPSVTSIHDAFVASPHHYENLVNTSYAYVGVGVTISNGTIFVTEDFMGTGGATPAPVPLAVTLAGATTTAQPGGYRMVTVGGQVLSYGATGPLGSANGPTSGAASTPSGRGYWLVSPSGGVFSFGDAAFHGSLGGIRLNQPIVGIAATPDGGGYWLVARDGGVFSFGDAGFHGSTGGIRLNQPIVGIAATPSGQGYRFVAADGGVFGFGDAAFYGSTGGIRLNQP
ncbi:MAG TPA: CAP domain-containing protein, partial [Acidimicrobiales bacterium]|nr:CAP domain-containing protein [Acidimicrobiales bacterium]